MRPEEYEISKEKFVLVNENKKLHDKELVTKPVGFFKDAMHRFAKNKGSIVGAIVIGILVLYAIIAPMVSPYTVSFRDPYYAYTLPKLFKNENIDFLDGCKKTESNEILLINYLSMGIETGHNAVKRQEYAKTSNGMYSYRLDSYHKKGMVFMKAVTKEDYFDIQNYQDENNVQIIYPITDPDQRPQTAINENDANYWYKTKLDGNRDVPVDYMFDDNGALHLTDIYVPYSTPVTMSTSSSKGASHVQVEAKGEGFALHLYEYVTLEDKSVEKRSQGYLVAHVANDEPTTFLSENFDYASVFVKDSTYDTYVTQINSFVDTTKNGYYFFGINSTRGSKAMMLPVSSLSDPSYIPFSFYFDGNIIPDPIVGQDYAYAADRQSSVDKVYYANPAAATATNPIVARTTKTTPTKIVFANYGGGYKVTIKGLPPGSFSVNRDGDKIDLGVSLLEPAVWHYDSERGGIYTVIDGLGAYYLVFCYQIKNNEDVSYFTLKMADQLGVDDRIVSIASSTFTPISGINPDGTTQYSLMVDFHSVNHKYYYFNGQYSGDNYNSKMRIEGDNVYKYSYAIQKDGQQFEIRVNYYEYFRYYHQHILKDRITEPYFLFGANAQGQDIFTCLASGARFSFILAITVAVVNMIIGAIYGAIEGYYGGKVDMIMERIVEILSAVPFMIVITLLRYHMKGANQALILFIAFFLTGWIGESGTVRMQFYRFKNQEYVLAARTLGAKDWRIMFRHIFPNSLGTIITGSVLVIPGMIFSETSLSYLGIINLNTGNRTSVGTLLAQAQPYLVTYPHMILFPAIFISLLMLCFNLFGNGLRDAFNPSLRGTED